MKITKTQLKKIIREELGAELESQEEEEQYWRVTQHYYLGPKEQGKKTFRVRAISDRDAGRKVWAAHARGGSEVVDGWWTMQSYPEPMEVDGITEL